MTLERNSRHRESPKRPNVVHVQDLMKQIERMAEIRRRVRRGYYDDPRVLQEIVAELTRRLNV